MNSPLEDFIDRTFGTEFFPRAPFDPTRPSPCSFGSIASDGTVQWRAVPRELDDSVVSVFADLDPQICRHASEFVGSYWCGRLECRFGYEYLTLDCGAWNDQDFDQKLTTIERRVGHRERNDRPRSLRLGWSASGTHCHFGMNLETGAVCIEERDGAQLQKIADSLPDFMAGLRYVPSADHLLASYAD